MINNRKQDESTGMLAYANTKLTKGVGVFTLENKASTLLNQMGSF